jgi:hypothetical protein
MEHKTACKVATTGHQDPNVLKSDPMWPEVPDEQTWIWTNDQKSIFEFLPQTPAAAAEITGVAASGFGFYRSQIPMVLQSMTQSAQSAVKMANITPCAHELRDTVADTMEDPSRDKLKKSRSSRYSHS